MRVVITYRGQTTPPIHRTMLNNIVTIEYNYKEIWFWFKDGSTKIDKVADIGHIIVREN